MNKTCQARVRRVARELDRHAGKIRRIRFTKNRPKILRPEDLALLIAIDLIAAGVAELASALRQSATEKAS